MLEITSLKKGIVIDHIRPGLGYRLFQLLKLDKQSQEVALIINANSPSRGQKDIIKIANEIDLNLDVIGLLDPHITVNYIEDSQIVKKVRLSLPEHVAGSLQCSNPACISVSERDVEGRFSLVDKERCIYRCDYCDHFYDMDPA